jgi:hypothetical protein
MKITHIKNNTLTNISFDNSQKVPYSLIIKEKNKLINRIINSLGPKLQLKTVTHSQIMKSL